MKKKALVGIALGVIMITSAAGAFNFPKDTSKIRDIEQKREQKLDVIDKASRSWQQGLIDQTQFTAVIDQSIVDTDALREEYLSLNPPQKYDKYKSLSIDSLDKQKEAFLKLREYVLAKDTPTGLSIRADFERLMTKSFEYRDEARKELGNIEG